MANVTSSIFSPRPGLLPSTPQSASTGSLLHRPWEPAPPSSSSTSSDTSNSSSMASSSFPFSPYSISAPVTPSGQTHSYFPAWYPLNHLLQHPRQPDSHDSPLPSPSAIYPAGLNSPFPAASATGQYLAHLNAVCSGSKSNGGAMLKCARRDVVIPPSSPTMVPLGSSPFSPNAPWSAPLSMSSYPLPSMPFNAAITSAHPSHSTSIKAEPGGAGGPSSSSLLTSPAETSRNPGVATSSYPVTHPQKAPAKKKRKPPPIKIDSSISNFSADTAHLHAIAAANQNGRHCPASAGHLLNVGPSFPLMSPGIQRGALSLPPPSPMLAAQFHLYQQQQQQQMEQQQQQNALRCMYEGPLTPLPSSGYGSVESQLGLGWPSGLNFAFLCFLPGTKLKFGTDDSPVKNEWQPAELFRRDNMNADFGHAFRVVCYVKNEQEGSSLNSVELTLRPVDLPEHLNVVIRALCASFHPFYDLSRGWVSLDPQTTRDYYGLACNPLRVSDTVALNPPVERFDGPWSGLDNNTPSFNILAEWAARNHHALALESHGGDGRNWGHFAPTTPSTPRGTKIKVKKEKKEKNPDKAKRPMNAFMLFAQTHRMRLTQLWPGRDNRAISCVLGEDWKRLLPDERQKYTDAAKKLADEYKAQNPDCWKRRPRSRTDGDLPPEGFPIDGPLVDGQLLMNYEEPIMKNESQDEPLDMSGIHREVEPPLPVYSVKLEDAPRE